MLEYSKPLESNPSPNEAKSNTLSQIGNRLCQRSSIENSSCCRIVSSSHRQLFQARICLKNRISPMETLLPEQTTSSDKMITPSGDLLFSQPVGGRNVSAVRSLSGDS